MRIYVTFVDVYESTRLPGYIEPCPSVAEEMDIDDIVSPTRAHHAVAHGFDLIGRTLEWLVDYRGSVVYVEGGHRFLRNGPPVHHCIMAPSHGDIENVHLVVNGEQYDALVQYKFVT